MRATVGVLVGLWGLGALAQGGGSASPPPPPAAASAPIAGTPQGDKPRLLVSDLVAQGAEASDAAALTDAVVQTLTGRGLFQVLSRGDVQTMLTTERQRQLLGACDADASACATDLGSVLGARYVMTGSLSKLGSTYELSLQVLDTVKSRTVGRSTRLARDVETLRQVVPWAVAEASGSPLPPPASRVLPYSLLAGGGAAVLGGGVYGLIALSRQKVLNDELCPGSDGPCAGQNLRPLSYYQEQDRKLGQDKTVAVGVMAAGALLVGAGLWLMPPPEGGP
ncbi:CsgG/HfaB family protein, partial [Pyxidicoccus sp. 3LFB2]